MSRRAASQFNILGITPTWNASTWSSRWGQLIWTMFLDCRQHLWSRSTARWLLHKIHSGNTKVLEISKLWHGFKISPILADFCYIYKAIFPYTVLVGQATQTTQPYFFRYLKYVCVKLLHLECLSLAQIMLLPSASFSSDIPGLTVWIYLSLLRTITY